MVNVEKVDVGVRKLTPNYVFVSHLKCFMRHNSEYGE